MVKNIPFSLQFFFFVYFRVFSNGVFFFFHNTNIYYLPRWCSDLYLFLQLTFKHFALSLKVQFVGSFIIFLPYEMKSNSTKCPQMPLGDLTFCISNTAVRLFQRYLNRCHNQSPLKPVPHLLDSSLTAAPQMCTLAGDELACCE